MTQIEKIQKRLSENSAAWAKTANRFLEEGRKAEGFSYLTSGSGEESSSLAKESNTAE